MRLKCLPTNTCFNLNALLYYHLHSLRCTGGVEANENNAKLAFLSSSFMGLLLLVCTKYKIN